MIANGNNGNNGSIFSKPKVTVTAVNLEIKYEGATSGYLGPDSQSLNGFTTDGGSTYTYSIYLKSSAILLKHEITEVLVNTPGFSVISVSPSLPYTFGPDSTFTITITLEVPSDSYTGTLDIVIITS